MNQYYKLKISLVDFEDRLNRVILFNAENDLDDLAFTVLSIFNTASYHLYMFKDQKNKYECDMSISEAKEMGYPDIGIYTYLVTIDKLVLKDNSFLMTYDFGENYQFKIEILEKVFLNQYFKISKVLNGVGYGIAEDDHYGLERYLKGEELDYLLAFIKHNRYYPVDFNEFNLEECNKKLKREIAKIRNKYLYYDLY